MNHKQAFKVRIRTHVLMMFTDWTSRELNKEPKNSSAKGGSSVLLSTLLIKTMGLWITVFLLFGIFKHSDSSKEAFLQSVCWKENRALILKRDAHRWFPPSMNSVEICAGKGLGQAICLGWHKSYSNVNCGYFDIECLTYSSICLIRLALTACFKPAEIWVHLPIDLGGLQFLSSLFFL